MKVTWGSTAHHTPPVISWAMANHPNKNWAREQRCNLQASFLKQTLYIEILTSWYIKAGKIPPLLLAEQWLITQTKTEQGRSDTSIISNISLIYWIKLNYLPYFYLYLYLCLYLASPHLGSEQKLEVGSLWHVWHVSVQKVGNLLIRHRWPSVGRHRDWSLTPSLQEEGGTFCERIDFHMSYQNFD